MEITDPLTSGIIEESAAGYLSVREDRHQLSICSQSVSHIDSDVLVKFASNSLHQPRKFRSNRRIGQRKECNREEVGSQMEQSQAVTVDRGPEQNFFDLGIDYSCGRQVAADLVEAHKWFNIAAMRGDIEAARRRQEIAAEMSALEIAAAQRRAREWLSVH